MMVQMLKLVAAGLSAAPIVNAHYIFNIMMHNGQQVGGEYDYVRKNSNSYNPAFMDIVNSNDLRCNVGASAGGTKTYDVKAGDQIGLKVFNNENIEHPGPGFFYMSKAPGDVASYDGSGDWFKVWESGATGAPNTNEGWGTWHATAMEFTLPASLPDGEYLLRAEHIGIHENHAGKPQFYIECAQIRVTGGGNGSPSPLVKIPGVYSTTDQALTYNFWGGGGSYEMPGPAVWGGGGGSGSPNQGTPTQGAPVQTPTQGAPVQTPTQGAPSQGTPVQGNPNQGNPWGNQGGNYQGFANKPGYNYFQG